MSIGVKLQYIVNHRHHDCGQSASTVRALFSPTRQSLRNISHPALILVLYLHLVLILGMLKIFSSLYDQSLTVFKRGL